MIDWQVVATEDEISSDKPKVVDFLGKAVALFKVGDELFAIDNLCPHQKAPLAEHGIVNETRKQVSCSWHGWKLDLKTGQCANIPGMKTNVYQVKLDSGVVSLGVSEAPDSTESAGSLGTRSGEEKELFDRVQQVMDSVINPGVASHGGVIRLLDLKEGVVYVEMGGGCQGCGMADETLKKGVESMIKQSVPEIKRVLDVTDHAAGSNPYFRGSV
jgi:NAD(P)H-dependent nitrite reductase small subunit